MVHTSTKDFLIRGEDYLSRYPDFKLTGRGKELAKLSGILMRKSAHNVMLVGAGGVGLSAICLGLQASKANPDAPFDMIGKRIFWLDSDGLFSSGQNGQINDSFQKILRTLSRSPDTVLVIDDTRDFIEGARNSGNPHLINALMRDINGGKFQAILEARDDDLEVILKSHSDMREIFTIQDVQEPHKDALHEIVSEAAKGLEKHHKIKIGGDAIDHAIALTSKYRVRDMSLSRAQPERSLNLLDRALTTYRQDAHSMPPVLRGYESQRLLLEAAISGRSVPIYTGLGAGELETLKIELDERIAETKTHWTANQEKLRHFYREQRAGEELIRTYEDELADQEEKDKAKAAGQEAEPEQPSAKAAFQGLGKFVAAGFGSSEANAIKDKMKVAEKAVSENKEKFEALTAEINKDLILGSEEVTREFSNISGIPLDKLNQDEREKLLGLEDGLKSRVFGQDHAVDKLAGAVRVARAGLKEADKPESAFLFAGPSGVGKTEMAKSLAAWLKDDERALLRFDMSEYMEKHAVAKLIGAPPGYEGYEAGGLLTNAIRRMPNAILLLDEIEKAHPDVFNVLLQVLDDGRLTDNRGLTVSFDQVNIIMTTNLGQPHFLNKDIDYDEAVTRATADLDATYKPEFLNRFNGRQNIVFFNRLELPVIEKIATREIDKVNKLIKSQGSGLSIRMGEADIKAMCEDKYDPAIGARGIPGYFKAEIYPAVATTMLKTPSAAGIIDVGYDKETKQLRMSHAKPDDEKSVAASPAPGMT